MKSMCVCVFNRLNCLRTMYNNAGNSVGVIFAWLYSAVLYRLRFNSCMSSALAVESYTDEQ